MSLSIINYIIGPIGALLGFYVVFKNPKSVNSVLFFLFLIAASLTTIFIGLAFDLGNMKLFELSLISVRLAGVSSLAMFLLVFRIFISFPYERRMNVLNVILSIFWIVASYVVLFTDNYVAGVELRNNVFFRVEGRLYRFFSIFNLLLIVISILVLYFRKRKFAESIHRLQASIIIWGFGFSTVFGILVTIVVPSVLGFFNIYPLSSLAGFGYIGSLFYAIVTYRMFDISTALHKTLLFLVLSSLVGLIAGTFSVLVYSLSSNVVLTQVFMFGLFLPLLAVRNLIQSRLVEVFRRKSDYASDLERELMQIDYSRDKNEVVLSFVDAFKRNTGAREVIVLYESTSGELVPEYPENYKNVSISKKRKSITFIGESDVDVLMKTEVITNPKFRDVKDDLLDLFNELGSEVMVFAKEGNDVIGMLCLTEKETLKHYDVYDYAALKRVIAYIYTFLYYVRNIERTSVVALVQRELKMSEEVMAAIQHSIGRVVHSNVDLGFITKSTSGLGGDFVDIINITSSKKYLIVVGDIAGKGLVASMLTVVVKSILRLLVNSRSDFKGLVAKLNEFMKLNFPRGSFFAGVFLLVDPEKRDIYYINCGIPLMCVYVEKYNNVLEIQSEGKVLGFVRDISKFISIKKIHLSPMDTLLVTTDGVIESVSLSGEKFGKEGVLESFKKNVNKSSRYIVDSIYTDLLEFTSGNIDDDVTLFVLKFTS